jgi:8-oxo-dGTP diphosphatase
VRSVVWLFSADYARVVLLERAVWKKFAPGRWTGIGGKLEGEELRVPEQGALRELQEETGLTLADLCEWRFVADVVDAGAGVRLVYYAAVFAQEELPSCNEGMLHWVELADYGRYDVIDNTGVVLEALLARGGAGTVGLVAVGKSLAEGGQTAGHVPLAEGGLVAEGGLPLRGWIERDEDGSLSLRLVVLPTPE